MRRLLVTTVVAAVLAMLLAAPAAVADTSSLTLSPHVVTLGHVTVGSTVEETVTLTNIGGEPLTLNSFEAFGYNGNFMVNPGSCTLGTTLAPGESCTFSVVTSPSVVGAIRGQFCYTGVGAATSDRECGRIVGGAS
jgi:Abnormal spindle-like microcephaly-assoc'd, ASPM-SPD-2-Hydin